MFFGIPHKLVCIVLFLALLGLIGRGVRDFNDELALRFCGRVAEAKVHELRWRENGSAYGVRYSFELLGDSTRYSSERWSEISHEAWKRADDHGWIDVAFLDRDPWVNRPVAATGELGNAIAELVAGLVGALVFGWASLPNPRGRISSTAGLAPFAMTLEQRRARRRAACAGE